MEREIWSSRHLLNKEYTDEDLYDLVERDIHNATSNEDGLLPLNEDGNIRGKFTVTIKWEDE